MYVGEKVSLHCTSPTVSPVSITWLYRPNPASSGSVLWRIVGDQMSQVDTSGRLSLKKTASTDFHLVIHDVLQTDSATYVCSVDVGYEKQHVTVLNVRGIEHTRSFHSMEYILLYPHMRIYYFQLVKENVRIIAVLPRKWCHNNEHFSELAPHHNGKTAGIEYGMK